MKRLILLGIFLVFLPYMVYGERLKVSSISVSPVQKEGKIKYLADITFNNSIKVKGMKLIEGSKGMFVGMPSEKKGEKWFDFCYAKDKELLTAIQKAIETKQPENITDKSVKVTEIRIKPYLSGKLKAWVSITLNDSFVIKSIRLLEAKRGLFIELPDKRILSGGYEPVIEVLNKETKDIIEKAILEQYKKDNSKARGR